MSEAHNRPPRAMQDRAGPARTMYYGKGDVWVFRTYGAPLRVMPVPESSYTGSEQTVLGANLRIAVSGEQFLSSFVDGDNALVVATDSMKNFILRQSARYEGATVDGLLAFVGRRLLETYPQIDGVRFEAEQVTFEAMQALTGAQLQPSDLVFKYSRNESATARIELVRTPQGSSVAAHAGGLAGLRLLKVKGSAFTGYVKDEYTTLVEAADRPLYIHLDMSWTYADPDDALDGERLRYVAAEQVRDIAAAVFHELYSPSIQHLVYRIGLRVLERYPQLAEVGFESNNRTWETVTEETASGQGGIYTEPRPPYGFQGFAVRRSDLEARGTHG